MKDMNEEIDALKEKHKAETEKLNVSHNILESRVCVVLFNSDGWYRYGKVEQFRSPLDVFYRGFLSICCTRQLCKVPCERVTI